MGGIASGIGGALGDVTGGIGGIAGNVVGGLTGGLYNGLGINNPFVAKAADIRPGVESYQLGDAYARSQNALNQQNNFLQALQAQNGVANQSNIYNQLGNIAAGQGPNPAQAMLAQQTGGNVANQAALMAGQRGASANPALIARQAAMQGANIQQQAVGQGATLQAQQALAALGQQGNIAGQQVGNLGSATQGYGQLAQQEQQNLLNALAQQNSANVAMQSNMNNVNAGISQGNQQAKSNVISGLTGAAGSAIGLAEGGKVPEDGSHKSFVGRFLNSPGSYPMMAAGGKVPVMVSPGELYIPPKDAKKVAESKANPKQVGEKIPGKAKVRGDSLKNDTVKRNLDAGGIVIPRSVVNSKNPEKEIIKFVQAVQARSSLKRPK